MMGDANMRHSQGRELALYLGHVYIYIYSVASMIFTFYVIHVSAVALLSTVYAVHPHCELIPKDIHT